MNDIELAAAVKAVREQAPPGMGDFTVRALAKAALEAAEKVRPKRVGAELFRESVADDPVGDMAVSSAEHDGL